MQWICKLFGHKYNPVDVLLLGIKFEAINRNELDLSITCSRCGSRRTPDIKELGTSANKQSTPCCPVCKGCNGSHDIDCTDPSCINT